MAVMGFRLNRSSYFSKMGLGFNLTPLIDIVFQLIVFFMVVSQVITVEREPMDLPSPQESQAEVKEIPARIIINVFSDPEGNITKIKVNAHIIRDVSELGEFLKRQVMIEGGFQDVILRAEKDLRFGQIKGLMQVISDAGISKLNISTKVEAR